MRGLHHVHLRFGNLVVQYVVEPVGNEAFLNLGCGGCDLVLRLPPYDLPAPGDTVHLGYAPERMHYFDPETELNLRAPPAAG